VQARFTAGLIYGNACSTAFRTLVAVLELELELELELGPLLLLAQLANNKAKGTGANHLNSFVFIKLFSECKEKTNIL
jgi:hypothetical protein